jgi:hypothetical protein
VVCTIYFSSCNWRTLTFAIWLLFLLQWDVSLSRNHVRIYYPFICNPTVVQVAIDIHSELQILSASAWDSTTPSVATGLRVAIDIHSELQILSAPAVPLDNILPVQLQPDSGSSCNWYTLRVANTKCFCLILYYPFRCNPIMVQVAFDVHFELQLKCLRSCNWGACHVATGALFELQLV